MWLGVLGPVECTLAGRAVEVKGRLNRALLAGLAVDPGRVTGVDELVDALWGDDPPNAAEKVVRNRVSLLRALLTPAFIATAGAGYRLGASVTVDARQFEDGRRTTAERLALWRGAPFGDITEWPPARAAAVRLGELRAHLQEVAVAEQLDGGVDASFLVGVAEQLVDTEPFRERRWALLMRTLYLAGRQHDALRAFDRARVLLRDECGLVPGAELLAVEQSILTHDPALWPQLSRRHSTTPRPTLTGRDDDAEQVCARLEEERLVTLVGLGGVGKSSLAREVATRWDGATHFVDFSAVDDPANVAETVSRDLRIAAGQDASAAIAGWASTASHCLVVLDNCEHVRDAAGDIASVFLGSRDGPSLVATSRIPLGQQSEVVVHVDPLARPDAVALYQARADRRQRHVADDSIIDRLCHLLGDVPLAIELAAARSSILSPAEMVRDLAAVTVRPFSTARTARWRNTGAQDVVEVVAWAVHALSADATCVFRRCAIFPGGFTMAAARTMTEADLDDAQLTMAFAELAEASLIQVRFGAGTRYHYLDLVRQRADDLLEQTGERELCETRMIRWAVDETNAVTNRDLGRLLADVTNLAAAAQHACRGADVEAALAITGATIVLMTAQRAELLDAMLAAVELPGAHQSERYVRSCADLGFALFILRGDVAKARHFAELVRNAETDSAAAGWATFTLGHIEGDLDHVRHALELARRWREPLLHFYASCLLVDNYGRGGAEEAWELVLQSDRLAAEIDEPWARVMATMVRGQAYCQLDPDAALVHLDRAAEMAERCGLPAYSTVARAMAGRAGGSSDPRGRLELTRHALLDADQANVSYFTVLALARVARTLTEIDRPDRAAIFAGAARARFHTPRDAATRLYQIDREDHHGHLAMFDLGATMEVRELVALLGKWLAELDAEHR